MAEEQISENRIVVAMRELNIDKKTYEVAASHLNTLLRRRKMRRSGDYNPTSRDLDHFFEFALPRVKEAQGQIFQDLWVLWETGEKRDGYFVEFGATNGITSSNSHILDKVYDWKGILAEPNPDYHQRLGKERSCHISHKCVYSVSGKVMKFLCAEKGIMSHLKDIAPEDHNTTSGRRETKNEIDVETISLDDLLDFYGAPDEIDYISVDTEGSEFEILSHFTFGKRRVKMFTIEHNFTPMRARLHELLTANGYVRRFPEYTRFDDWYIHGDFAGD